MLLRQDIPSKERSSGSAPKHRGGLRTQRSRFGRIGAWLFVTPIIAMVGFSTVALFTLQSFRGEQQSLSHDRTQALERLNNLAILSSEMAALHAGLTHSLEQAQFGYDLPNNTAAIKARLDELGNIETSAVGNSARFLTSSPDKSVYRELVDRLQAYASHAERSAEFAMSQAPETHAGVLLLQAAYRDLFASHTVLSAQTVDEARELTRTIERNQDAFARDLILILFCTAAASLLASWIISLLLSRDLSSVIQAMTGLAEGKQTTTVLSLERSDEIGDMARATQVFSDTLGRLREEIEQREKTEDALRAERNFVSAINETVGALILVLDRSGRIVRFNRACEEVTGLTLGEVVGTRLWDRVIAPADRDRVRSEIDALGSGQRHCAFEAACSLSSGEERQIVWSNTTLVDHRGAVEYVICCGTDITERKLAEERLQQAHRMEAIGQLTGGIAHDFNNLLAVILIDLDLVHRRLGDDEHAKRMLEHAVNAGQRGAALTNSLLSFSRQQPLRPETIQLDDVLENMISLFSGAMGEKTQIFMTSQEGLWPCKVDQHRLAEALLNLSLNASEAMPKGGRLEIQANNTRLLASELPEDSGLTPGDYVELALTDSGHGIPEDVRPHIFEPFFTTKEVGAGSGLGLSMVYGFMKQSQGHVTVNSLEGWGTTFRLYFPRDRSAAEEEMSSEQAALDASEPGFAAVATGDADRVEEAAPVEEEAPCVLVVEDNADLRMLTCTLLDDLGYRILEASNGPAALELIDAGREVDLLLADLHLPGGMNGTELATQARTRLPALKVLFMTGYTETGRCAPKEIAGESLVLGKTVSEVRARFGTPADPRELAQPLYLEHLREARRADLPGWGRFAHCNHS